MSNDTCVIAIDAGTTGVRSRAVFPDGKPAVASYREFTQHFPQPGWVEHDAQEIWAAVVATLSDVIDDVGRDTVAAIGITNQRETVVAWSRSTGVPYGNAIVWQDRRTAARCDQLEAAGHLDLVRRQTGLVLDPYFSGTKIEWLLQHREIPVDDDLALGTIDAWLIWNLTGGAVHATDVTNASRTLLYDIVERRWSPELCDLLNVPITALPDGASVERPIRRHLRHLRSRTGGIPVSGVAGDQQAALFGQACFEPGMAKNTYGTGSFVLLNVGATCPPPTEGMLTTIAWELADGTVTYALEGAIFVTGAAIQWLRDGINIIDDAAEIGPLAESVPDSGGVFVVPAFAGLGSPWWDPYARGTIVGITRGTTRAHIATSRRRGDDLPDPRRGRRHGGRQRHADHRSARRRRRLGDGLHAADAGRPARRHRAPSGRSGDHGARGRLPRRLGRGRLARPRRDPGDLAARRHVRARARPNVHRPRACPMAARSRTQSRLDRGLSDMGFRRDKPQPKASELFRAPIITERLIIREATRADAQTLERSMDAAEVAAGARTVDGARRFDSGLAEVPVWSATRAVCEKGSVRIVGGVVLTEVDMHAGDTPRIGWWLEPDADRYGERTRARRRRPTPGDGRRHRRHASPHR